MRQNEFPPREFLSKLVSFDSRYGTWIDRLLTWVIAFYFSFNLVITFRKHINDLFIPMVSFCIFMFEFALLSKKLSLSLPAKSTSMHLETRGSSI